MSFFKEVLLFLIVSLTVVSSAAGQTEGAKPIDLCLGGQPNAPIRVEVFSDFQCSYCRDFYLETIRPLLKEVAHQNKVCVGYYEFPLSIHPYSREASRYGVAAKRLGQDPWQRVAEALYGEQPQWGKDGKIEPVVARVLSAEEMAKVKKLLEGPSIDQAVDQDILLGNRRQVKKTPTFFISAKGREEKIAGKVSYEVLKDHLERLLK
jgi:protein-disulfide isomerase